MSWVDKILQHETVRSVTLEKIGGVYVITASSYGNRHDNRHAVHIAIAEIMHDRGPYSLVIA